VRYQANLLLTFVKVKQNKGLALHLQVTSVTLLIFSFGENIGSYRPHICGPILIHDIAQTDM